MKDQDLHKTEIERKINAAIENGPQLPRLQAGSDFYAKIQAKLADAPETESPPPTLRRPLFLRKTVLQTLSIAAGLFLGIVAGVSLAGSSQQTQASTGDLVSAFGDDFFLSQPEETSTFTLFQEL